MDISIKSTNSINYNVALLASIVASLVRPIDYSTKVSVGGHLFEF